MGVIHIEDVDEKVMKSLRLRARINGRSLEDEVRALLAETAERRMTAEERADKAKRIRAMTRGWSTETDSVSVIREIRDR